MAHERLETRVLPPGNRVSLGFRGLVETFRRNVSLLEKLRREEQEEQTQREQPDEFAPPGERRDVVDRFGVPQPREQGEERPRPPAAPRGKAHDKQGRESRGPQWTRGVAQRR